MTTVRTQVRRERGIALLLTLMVILVLVSLTGALIPITSTATSIVANHRRAAQGVYAAEAALAWAVAEIRTASPGGGVRRSSFQVGSRHRQLPDGAIWDLNAAADDLRRNGAGSSGAGRGLPWKVYAYGPLAGLVPHDPSGGTLTIAVWVAEVGSAPEEVLVLHVVAAGPGYLRRAVQATVRVSVPGHRLSVTNWALVQ